MPLPHAGVCSQPPALPRGCFIPVLSELNSPMLFLRREQGLKALGEEWGRRVKKEKAMSQGGYKWVRTRRRSCCPVQGEMGEMDYGL